MENDVKIEDSLSEEKFTYSKEDAQALKTYKSRAEVEEEDKKAGKKTIWYE